MITDQKAACRTRVKPLKRQRYLRGRAETVPQALGDLYAETPDWPAYPQTRPEQPRRPQAPVLAVHAWNGGMHLIRAARYVR